MPNILIAASGTGGHIYPALAIAESLPAEWKVVWLGVPNRLEINLVPKEFNLVKINVGGLQGNLFNKLLKLFKLIISIIPVIRIIKRNQIDVVFTTGGYISAPSILACKILNVKVILHESNAIPGRVSSLLGRFCDEVHLGFDLNDSYLYGCKKKITGTPLRDQFYIKQKRPNWLPSGEGLLIIIIGGSQGSLSLNRLIEGSLELLIEVGCRVVHLHGPNEKSVNKFKHPNLVKKIFSDEMPALLQHSDLVISRAGAGIINELIITNTPSILIPFSKASLDHQSANASYLASKGAACIISENCSLINFQNSLLRIIDTKSNRILSKMKENIKSIKTRDSKSMVLESIFNYN
tara:strand:- start:1929 stop:2981 length:1053 start_codon:yes stop_codon:yes gene_type:complete